MKVQPSASVLERILNTDSNNINISYKNRDEINSVLNKIEPLVLTKEPRFDDFTGIVSISPRTANVEYQFHLLPVRMRDKVKGYIPKRILIPYFEGDIQLYKLLSQRTSSCKIIEDEFSVLRGSILFEHISRIEKGIREEIVRFYNLDDAKKSTHHRKDTPDYFLNFFPLHELIDDYLLSPVSNQHFVELIREAKGKKSKILEARAKTKLEELNLPFSEDEILKFAKIRNKAMHFRVVTAEDSQELLGMAEEFDNFEYEKILKFPKADSN